MDAFELLKTRASNGKLREPAPDDATLLRIVDCALRAPDHGLLRPFRVQLVRGEARQRLGQLMRSALQRREPATPLEALEKEERKPLRAPLIVVVSASVRPDPKVPAIEQVLAAGALAHGVLLGLHASGFSGIWRTGPAAYDDTIKRAFGLRPEDALVGFLYAGTASQPAPTIERPSAAHVLEDWTG